MKKYIYISAVLFGSLCATTSCDMDAPTKSSLDAQTVASVYELAEAAVMGINQSFGETNSYRGRFLPYYGLNTDIEWINGNGGDKMPDESKYDLCTYNATPTNSQMNTATNAYAKFYEGIERANMSIKAIREYGDLSNPNMAQLLGELLTMRSVLYLDLIKGWGDVPARWEPISTETMYLGRTDRDEIYKHLLDDLAEASELCFWPNESGITGTSERVNKAFVKGLRARVALYAGGYSQRADGTVRLSNDPDLAPEKMYQIAKDECVAIINSKTCELGSFKENFLNLCRDVVAAGKESLWEIPFSPTRGRVLYTYGIKHQGKDAYTQQSQGGVNGPLPTLFYDYDVEDIRRDITCAPYRWSNSAKSIQELWSAKSWCFGKLRYEWMDRIVTNTNDDGVNWQYMRLADVYLMAAEAINQLDGPQQAWPYMKPILDRALPASKVAALGSKYTASKAAFQDGIVDQRAFEFAGEMLRKADLIRWNMLSSKLKEAQAKMRRLRNQEGEYADLPLKLYFTWVTPAEHNDPDVQYLLSKLPDTEANASLKAGYPESEWKTTPQFLKIYGLNHGDTDEQGKLLEANEGYSSTTWLGESKITDGYIEALYYSQNDPDKHQYWPIWAEFIDKSNNMLNNDWLK